MTRTGSRSPWRQTSTTSSTCTSIDGGGNSLISGGINGVYNSSGVAQTVHLIEVDPEIKLFIDPNNPLVAWWEKRRAYFEPTVGGTYYLEVGPDSHDGAGLAGGTYAQSQPTYTVRVRKADDHGHNPDSTTAGSVSVGGSVRGHFYTEHNSTVDQDWIHVNLTGGQTYLFTLTGHATANTQMRIISVADSNGVRISYGADANRYSSTVSFRFTPTDDGNYYVVLSSRQHADSKHPAPDYTFTSLRR